MKSIIKKAFSILPVLQGMTCLLVHGQVLNPTGSKNYIAIYAPRVKGIVTSTGLNTASSDKTLVRTSVQYFDGLGKPIQIVQVKASPTGHDVVQPIAYDQYEREITKYLRYALTGGATNDGSYKATAINDQAAFYVSPPTGVSVNNYPYSQVNLEASPVSRPLEQGTPGTAWQLSGSGVSGSGHTIKTRYTTNNYITLSDTANSTLVVMYSATVNPNQSRTLTVNGYYQANQLNVTVTMDENWVSGRAGTTETYTDKEGHVVLKRTYNYTAGLQTLSTYYVYDDLGNLVYVLPPLANGDAAAVPSPATLNNLCYQYRYDARNRLSQKKIPGKGWEYAVYNVSDQPVAIQDSLQRNNNNWIFTKYDALGRVTWTGVWNNNNVAISQTALQATITTITTNLWETPTVGGNGYTNVAWPTINVTTTLGLNYYDSYTNLPGPMATYQTTYGTSKMTLGLLTSKKTAVLNTPTDMLWDVVYYDDLGRTIATYDQHYLGGTTNINANNYDLTTTIYNFTNIPTIVTRKHFNTTSTTIPLVTIVNNYIYDHVGRKLKSWEQITNGNSAPTTKTLLSQMVYNEIGQLMTKQLHSTDSVNFFQNIAYTYNDRGWLLTSSAPLFAMQLYYNTGTAKAYNGNIMNQHWGTPGNLNKYFDYTYDKLNRLTAGGSSEGYAEQSISYDVMGNINTLNRYQPGLLIDQLTYTYTSGGNPTNQLQSINDATTSDYGLKHGPSAFTYDGNGNMVTDPTKGTGITIGYNMLNLPQTVTGGKTVTYTYTATGQKLRRVSPVTGNTDYITGIQYDGTTTPSLSFIQTEEGKAVPNGTGYDYEYYLGDHLGNTRVTFGTKTGVAVSYQQDDYYPFGMEISRNVLSPKNEYLYNKKELQEELQELDYGARFYDPVIARWNTIDPLAEISRRWSPYTYVENDPIRLVDPDGMTTADWMEQHGLTQKDLKHIYTAQTEKEDDDKTGEGQPQENKSCCATPVIDALKTANKSIENRIKKGASVNELIELFKKLNTGYGILAKFNPKRFKYSGYIDGIINFVDVVHSNSKDERTDKILNILLEKGLDHIELGELKIIYDALDYNYNQTLMGTAQMAANAYESYLDIVKNPDSDLTPGSFDRKAADNFHNIYVEYKEKFYEIFREEYGYYPKEMYLQPK